MSLPKRLAVAAVVALVLDTLFYFTIMKTDNPPAVWIFYMFCALAGGVAGVWAAVPE